MKRHLLIAIAALVALPLAAQQQEQTAAAAPAKDDGSKVVAVVNGETITRAKLDQLWHRIGAQARAQYAKAGGKNAFLDNYIGKRLVVQEALKSKFEQQPEVAAEIEAAREAAIFDRYVRDVVSQPIVTEEAIRKYYEENKAQFAVPEKAKIRHIIISTQNPNRTKEQALAQAKTIAQQLGGVRPMDKSPAAINAFLARFAEAAAKYSEDPSGVSGGDLGWVERGFLDTKFNEAAFSIPVATLSGIVETQFGYHLIFVEDRRPAGFEPYEKARATVREFLIAQNSQSVVQRVNLLTEELKDTGKIEVFPENID